MVIENSDEGIQEIRRRLVAGARRSCPPWLQDHVEDIAHTVMVRLIAREGRGGGIGSFRASYLERAAYSAMIDEIRRKFRRREVREGGDAMLDDRPSTSPEPDRTTAASQIHVGVRDCLAAMIRPRRIAVACHLQGYSVPETARFTGWTRKKSEHLVRRGLDDLRDCLTSKGLNP